MLMRLLLLPMLAAADDTVCSFQKQPKIEGLLDLDTSPYTRVKNAHPNHPGGLPQDLWSSPGLGFRQCPTKSSVRTVQLLVRPHSKHSPEAQPKPKCLPKEVLIGDFVGDAYEFSCCDAGEQCGGCRAVKDGACQKCAAGYVMQTIPVLGTSKCFVCDDVPNWHDMHGRSCADLQKLGICSGAWPKEDQDVAFQGVRPSEACCACGGGSIYPTPVYMPLQSKSLHFGQNIDETPSPITAGEQMVAPGCTLASSGLELGKDGRISGEVTMSNQTVIKCSTVSVQDPVRGIVANIDLSVPVSTFSYGQQTVFFKFWGLDRTPSRQIVRLRSKNRRKLKLTSFQLQCDPACPWLSITSKGDLLWNSTNGHVPHGRAGSPVASDDLTEVTTLAGMPSCSCQVLATLQTQQVSTQFLAAQARLWKGAVWDVPSIVARISTEILEVPLLEDLGPGLRWYNRSGHVLQVPVVQNIETGETFVVSESISPTILDVDCKDHQGRILSWSRKSGEVMLDNELAFQLDPSTGAISGTPRLSLPATQGRAEVNVTCHVALGGPFYDQALPVAIFHIRLLDDVCWVPRNISGHFRWKEKSVQEPQCLQTCRLRDDCAAVQYKEDTCRFMVSDGKETFLDGQVLVRLNNCSEQDASLNLAVPGAQYLQGEFGVMNFYQNDASYSRAGSLPERQLVLGRRASVQRIPESCAKSSWFLLHINTSDFEDSTLINAPEFFGDTIACIDSDVVSKAFKHGQDAFDLRLLPREVESTPLYDQPPALQHGTLALGVPPCEKPSQDLLLGTLSEPGIYSLHPCECFGAAYASVEPVHEDSDAAVPRNPQGYFNNGSVSDQLLFSGPYTCEESASVGHFSHLEMDECQRACASKSECQFYLFGKTAQTCTLFQSCSYIQDVGLQITNEVYGMSPEFGSYCRIANPEQCWQEIKRRSMLSFTPSNLPSCLFQEQYEACDALQLLLGKQDGPCSRCQYIDASSAFAAVGLKKVPPPEDFPSASQILVSCNDTSRMFSRLQNGLRWEGPMQGDATFTCVSGEWVGELGPWQYLTNLTCQRCIQIGTGSLQRLSLVSMPEVYFLEHRQVHVNYPFATHGCARAGILTPSRLRPDVNVKVFLDVSKDNTLVLSAEPLAIWWIDALSEQLRVSSEALDSRKEWCICTDKPQLYTCACGQSKKKHMEVNRGLLQDYYGLRCLRMDQTLKFEACPTGPREKFLWHFESGNCFFGFDLTNTAEKRWTATSEAESSKPLRLGNFAFKDIVSPEAGLSQIYLDYLEMDAHLCLHADMSQPLGSGYVMQISDDCRSAFLWRGAHLVYFHHSDLKKSYYVQMASSGENQVLIATTQAISEADDKFEIFEGKLVRVGHPTKCLQAKKVEPVPLSNGLRSMVAGPSAPQYSPCTSYGEFSGDGEYYQVCRESPLVKKVQQQTFRPWVANREELPAFALRCLSARTVLTNISWPTSIPAPGYGGRIIGEVNATCAVLGSRNAVSSMRQERFPVKYNASSHFVNFSCPPDMVLDLVQFVDDVHFMRCTHGWETLIAADPSSPSDVYFEDCSDIWTQSWSIQRIPQQNHSFSSWMELGSCEASLSVATQATNPDADAEFLNLSIPDLPQLSPKEKDAYTRSPAIHITTDDSDRLLFTCLPGQSKGPLLDGNLSTLCASHVALRRSDLFGATSLFKDNFQTLLTQKSCPVLMDPSISVGPSIARNTAKGGMTMQQLSHILRLAYYATPFGDPHKDPFNYTGYDAVFAERVGFVSLLQGGAPWGLKCPSGAVVASDQTTTPYCLQVGASSEQTFYAFSGSMSCPDGTAVSGWYNLPGIHVKGGPLGGPTNATKLRLYCRSTPLLSSCEQPTTSYCQGGRVVVSVSFDSNKFKLGCCQWQRRLGMALTESPRRTWTYKDFSGYYCPIGIDVTGAAAYEKTFIASMGSPQEQPVKAHQRHRIDTSMWTLSWNRFVEHWEIRQKGQLVASLPGDDATPVAANGTASAFSATFITPLTAAYVIASKPQSPFPKQKPMAPKLLAFHADQPDYKEYCDPAYLQNPSAFPDSESITQTNPCFHVFNSQPAQLQPEPKTPLLKGITEQAFWQCAERSKRRTYMSDFTVVNKAERDAAVKKAQKKISHIALALELTAMVSAMIPWGSYAEPGAKGAEVGQKKLEDVAEEQLGRMAEQAAREGKEAAAKTFAQKLKDAASSAMSGANRFVSSTLQKIRKKGPFKILLGQRAFKAGAQISKFFKASKNMKKPPSAGELKNMSQELITQTVPEMSESYTKDLTALAEASWKDCLPIQFGLSKVMCDLFCIDDAVRSGTSAVLESLEDSHNVLMTNIQALLDYQTQYLLGAIGTVLNPQTREDSQEHEILSASAVLQELREFPKHNAQNDDLTLNRDVLDWHRATGDELISRITAMSINASTASRPHRVRSLKGMLYHYRNSLHERLNGPTPSVASVAQRQIKDKLQLLSDQASEHRAVTRVAKSLRQKFPATVPLELSDQVVWSSILESFLHTQEKHDTFTMLHLKALDQMDYAVYLAQNFSQCAGADTALLREVWQRAMRAEDRCNEALLEAWSATMTTSERLEVATQDQGFLHNWVQHMDLGTLDDGEVLDDCENHTALVQRIYGMAVAKVSTSFQPLALQINTFKVLASYQERQLQHRRLDYVSAPTPPALSSMEELKSLVQAIAEPSSLEGQALAARATKVSEQFCPGEEFLLEDIILQAEPVKDLLLL